MYLLRLDCNGMNRMNYDGMDEVVKMGLQWNE